jgi:aldehyde dehydrogenase (NAD+)
LNAPRPEPKAARYATSSTVQQRKNLLIGGKWLPAKSGKTFETINPANEEVLAIAAEGDKADVDDAVKSARNAFESGAWPAMGPHQRARYLYKIADLVEAHREELAELITLDNGKPISESDVEVTRTVDTFRYYAGWATKFYGETNRPIPVSSTTRCASPSACADRSSPGTVLSRR